MKEIEFSVEINATKDKVWSVLWEGVSFRDWAGIIGSVKFVMKKRFKRIFRFCIRFLKYNDVRST